MILFDEVEKAHPDVFNLLLQILEDGRLTDGQGRVVDFKNTVIVMTSNAGAHTIKKQRSLGFGSSANSEKTYDDMKDNIMGEVRQIFRPEFLNRVDEIIVFHALTEGEIEQIARLLVAQVCARLSERGIELDAGRRGDEVASAKTAATCSTVRVRCAGPFSGWWRMRSARRSCWGTSIWATACWAQFATARWPLKPFARSRSESSSLREARSIEYRLNFQRGGRGRRLRVAALEPVQNAAGRVGHGGAFFAREQLAALVEQPMAGKNGVLNAPGRVRVRVGEAQRLSGFAREGSCQRRLAVHGAQHEVVRRRRCAR